MFIQYEDWKAPEKEIKKWYNLGLFFFFKKASKILLVGVHNCMPCFAKPQQAIIVSWFLDYLKEHPKIKTVFIPLYLKEASYLVGAPLGSMSHKELA